MKIGTLSIVVGTGACNASCPFCVSKMTPPNGVGNMPSPIRWDRFSKAMLFAERMNVTTVLLTGKGEPTLFQTDITKYLDKIDYRFPFIELQTNGLAIADESVSFGTLAGWQSAGLTTVALSIVSHKPEVNKEIYLGHKPNATYPDLVPLIRKLHTVGVSVRLTCMMLQGGVDDWDELKELIIFAKENDVEQLTVRSIFAPTHFENPDIYDWVRKNLLTQKQTSNIFNYLREKGNLVLTLQHGAKVFDVDGQNVCLSNCLTLPKGEEIRQAIFFPDGHLRYDWTYPGAILM